MPDTITTTSRIPVLDIGPYLAGEPGALPPLAVAIARTCEDTGFSGRRQPRRAAAPARARLRRGGAVFCSPCRGQTRAEDRPIQYRLSAVRRADRAAFAGQQKYPA